MRLIELLSAPSFINACAPAVIRLLNSESSDVTLDIGHGCFPPLPRTLTKKRNQQTDFQSTAVLHEKEEEEEEEEEKNSYIITRLTSISFL